MQFPICPFSESLDSSEQARSSPTEEISTKSKAETSEEFLDSKDHVNVIFIGHVGKSNFLINWDKVSFFKFSNLTDGTFCNLSY